MNEASLAERFDRGDDAADHAAYYATNRIPTAHPQPTEGAASYTKQDVTDRMFCRSRQDPAAATRFCRNGVVGNHPDDRQRDRSGPGIAQHPFMQGLRVTAKLLELALGADGEAARSQFEQRALFGVGDGSAAGQPANGFVIAFLRSGPS